MKKQTKSEKIRRAMVIAVASMMVMGMPMVVNAEGEDTEPSEPTSSSESSSESSSDSHESKSESSSTSHESSEKASSASSESKKAESSAKESSEKASEASKAASEASESAKSAADSVNSDSKSKDEMSNAASEAKDAVDSAAKTVAEKDAEYASSSETKTADSSEDASAVEAGSEETSSKDSEVKEAKEITQGLEKAIESIESAESSISGQADAIKESAGAAIADMKENFEKVFSDDATITENERKEAAQAVVDAADTVSKELEKAEQAKKAAADELAQAEKEYKEYLAKYSNITNSIFNENSAEINAAVDEAEQAVVDAQAKMTEKLSAYNEAAAECEKQADLAQAASEAAAAAAEKAELAYHKAEEAAEDAENAVDAKQITDAEKNNIYFAQVDTAKATLEARKHAEEAAAAAKEAEQQRKEVEAALDKQITDAEDTLAKAQENLAMVQRQAYKYDSAKAFGAMLERLTNARKAVAEAEQALKEAKQDAATYQKFANYYLGTDSTSNISTRKITAYAQKNADGNGLAKENSRNFDVKDSDVISRSSSLFTQVSEGTIDVPDEIYRLYLKAMIDNQAKLTKNGAGIATGTVTDEGKAKEIKGESMPVIYWKVDENDKLTGEYFTDITYQPSGKYFVGYVFKRESDIATRGYHIDGFMVEHEQRTRDYERIPDVPGDCNPDSETPSTPNTNPGGGNGGNGGNGGSGGGNPGTTTPVVTITDDPVSLADMIDQAAIEILDGPVALAASVPGDVIIGDEDVPLADSIPQTGDNAVSMLPVMLSGIAAIGAALGLGKKKEEK